MIAERTTTIDDRTKEELKDRLAEWLEHVTGQPVQVRSETRFDAFCPFCNHRKPKFEAALKGCWQGTCRVCGKGGDLIKIAQELYGCGFAEAVQRAAGAVGFPIPGAVEIPRETQGEREARRRERESRARELEQAKELEDAEKRKAWPRFFENLDDGCREVSRLRGIPAAGIRAAHRWGMLRFCDWGDGLNEVKPCWALRSHDGTCAELRRLDGEQIQVSRDTWAKAKALPGSRKKRALIGEHLLFGMDREPVLFAEGAPDILVACWLSLFASAKDELPVWVPCGCLGVQFDFTPEQLGKLSGRLVRIFVDDDQAGRDAAERWTRDLHGVGCDVELMHVCRLARRLPGGKPIKDLNDALVAHSESIEAFSRKVVEL
jgi:hypothetical protein